MFEMEKTNRLTKCPIFIASFQFYGMMGSVNKLKQFMRLIVRLLPFQQVVVIMCVKIQLIIGATTMETFSAFYLHRLLEVVAINHPFLTQSIGL
jgi:hypothetical protein